LVLGQCGEELSFTSLILAQSEGVWGHHPQPTMWPFGVVLVVPCVDQDTGLSDRVELFDVEGSVIPIFLAAMGIGIPWPVSFSISRNLAMICSTVCFFTGTRHLHHS
jgi:hypothetical protein